MCISLEIALGQMIEQFVQNYGLLGLFLVAIFTNATVLLPVPLDIFIFIISGFAQGIPHALLIALVAGFGAAIGETTSYFLGLFGITAIEKARNTQLKQLDEVRRRVRDSGMLFIIAGAMIPFPFDLIGIACGMIKYPLKKFFTAIFIGRLVRYTIISLAGFYGVTAVKAIFIF